MKISISKTKVMSEGKFRRNIRSTLNEEILEQVKEFTYLGCIFTESGSLDRKIDKKKR